jgi:phenylacetic acid degradation protein
VSVWSWDGIVPVVDPTAFVHPDATLIGDVIVAAGVYVGPQCVLRGDFGRIEIGQGANVQETCVVHTFPNLGVVVEASGHIGHGAVLHGCVVRRGALVGMNAVVMDEAEFGEQAIVAASAFVRAGMKVPPRTLVAGVPGKVLRELSAQEIEWKHDGTRVYQALVPRCHASLREVTPLPADDRGRRRLTAADFEGDVRPLVATKAQPKGG